MADIRNVAPNVGARVYIVWTISNTTMIDSGRGFRKSGTVSRGKTQEYLRALAKEPSGKVNTFPEGSFLHMESFPKN